MMTMCQESEMINDDTLNCVISIVIYVNELLDYRRASLRRTFTSKTFGTLSLHSASHSWGPSSSLLATR